MTGEKSREGFGEGSEMRVRPRQSVRPAANIGLTAHRVRERCLWLLSRVRRVSTAAAFGFEEASVPRLILVYSLSLSRPSSILISVVRRKHPRMWAGRRNWPLKRQRP